ncbi:hypothetical protein [Desmospora activa]|uniref:Uncharacterized protein n=1 Tax=Desmospora activa DSM 45169 TaxID=1121389 RepID=A0A2T4YZS1_9BACL|nr:hypothetical protein [Desmospora activa]PTM52696.1 hypothetical protein C8J48_3689 [Desmospora activa DSM 45169]
MKGHWSNLFARREQQSAQTQPIKLLHNEAEDRFYELKEGQNKKEIDPKKLDQLQLSTAIIHKQNRIEETLQDWYKNPVAIQLDVLENLLKYRIILYEEYQRLLDLRKGGRA